MKDVPNAILIAKKYAYLFPGSYRVEIPVFDVPIGANLIKAIFFAF